MTPDVYGSLATAVQRETGAMIRLGEDWGSVATKILDAVQQLTAERDALREVAALAQELMIEIEDGGPTGDMLLAAMVNVRRKRQATQC